MAHAVKTSGLTEELVQIITNYSPKDSPRAYRSAKDTASRTLRQHRHGRTNQFAVRSSLSGLVEKFQILNNEPLADALDAQLKELDAATASSKSSTKWTPEVLNLLLLLSDWPAEKTRLEDLGKDEEPEPTQHVLPSWKKMLKDDGEDEHGLWRDIDFGEGSEEEDEETIISKGSSHIPGSTAPSSEGEEDAQLTLDSLVQQPDASALHSLLEARSWRNHDSRALKVNVPESDVIRETLHTLLGLPSTLYEKDPRTGKLVPMPQYSVENCSQSAFQHFLHNFAELTTTIRSLRKYCSRRQETPLLQRFTDCILNALKDFDNNLHRLAGRYVGISGPVVVSLLSLEQEVTHHSTFLLSLHFILSKTFSQIEARPYKLLDTIYDAVLDAQSVGNDSHFSAFGIMLFRCLEIYLQPVRRWMESGELEFDEDDDFPVAIREGHIQLGTFWQDRFDLRRSPDASDGGSWLAPIFLQDSLPEVLASGKSVAFMRELGIAERLPDIPREDGSQLSFSDLYPADSNDSLLVPFESAFNAVLALWIRSKHQHTSSLLCSHILHDCGLLRTIDALETIYLSRDGGLFSEFAGQVFKRVDGGNGLKEGDGLALEDAARSVFGSVSAVDASAISIHLDKNNSGAARKKKGRAAALESVMLEYHLPWPLANIIPPNTLRTTHQPIWILLLHLHRTKTSLARPIRLLSGPTITAQTGAQTTHIALQIRHRLLHVLHALSDHVTYSVLLPSYQRLQHTLSSHPSSSAQNPKSESIDTLVQALSVRHDVLYSGAFLTEDARTTRNCVVGLCEITDAFARLLSEREMTKGTSADTVAFKKVKRQVAELTGVLVAELVGLGRSRKQEEGKGKVIWDWEGLAKRLEWWNQG